MTKIRERVLPWLRRVSVSEEGEYGIEIETETNSSDDYPEGFLKAKTDDFGKKYMATPKLKSWMGHYDNSLRNFGVEFVFKNAMSFEDANKALDEFGEKTKVVPFLKDVPSTSVHVHWNVFNETFLTMANFFGLYCLYENLLISHCGPTRRSNLFALPLRVSETTVGNIVKMLSQLARGSTSGMMVSDHHAKYGALNISTLNRFGSLEIRPMRGLTDADAIKEWLSIINHIILLSRQDKLTPQKILDLYRDDRNELFNQTFGDKTEILRVSAETDPEHGFDYLIQKNLWYLKEIAESVEDWSKFNSCMDKVFEDYQKTQEETLKRLQSKKSGSIQQGYVVAPALPDNWHQQLADFVAANEVQSLSSSATGMLEPNTPTPQPTINPVNEFLSGDDDVYIEDDEPVF